VERQGGPGEVIGPALQVEGLTVHALATHEHDDLPPKGRPFLVRDDGDD
jgi:hypothetical protein